MTYTYDIIYFKDGKEITESISSYVKLSIKSASRIYPVGDKLSIKYTGKI